MDGGVDQVTAWKAKGWEDEGLEFAGTYGVSSITIGYFDFFFSLL